MPQTLEFTASVASPARFERAAFHLGGERSIQLSYGDKYEIGALREWSIVRLGGERSILLSYRRTRHARAWPYGSSIIAQATGAVKPQTVRGSGRV